MVVFICLLGQWEIGAFGFGLYTRGMAKFGGCKKSVVVRSTRRNAVGGKNSEDAASRVRRNAAGGKDGEDAASLSKEEEARMREMIDKLYKKDEMLDPKDYPDLFINDDDGDMETIYRDSGEFVSIFDDPDMLGKPGANGYERHSVAMQTLREISECYCFSLSFLGDFVVELGAFPPVNIDTPICNYLTGDQIYSLLQSLNSLEPGAASIEYDSTTAADLCDVLDISTKTLLRICSTEGFNLPFGLESVLHSSVQERIAQCATHDEYRSEGSVTDDDYEDGEEDADEEAEADEDAREGRYLHGLAPDEFLQ